MVSAPRVLFLSAAAAAVVAGTWLGCNGILGIPEATLDNGTDAGACGTYCSTVLQNCSGLDYLDYNTCLSICGAFEPGLPTETAGDDLGCRTHYALAAATDKTKCEAAGAMGGGLCTNPEPCVTFCALDLAICSGPNAVYDGGGDCIGQCEANFDTYVLDGGPDLANVDDSNTINCRTYHLQAALGGGTSLATHCPHTTVASYYCHNYYDGPPP